MHFSPNLAEILISICASFGSYSPAMHIWVEICIDSLKHLNQTGIFSINNEQDNMIKQIRDATKRLKNRIAAPPLRRGALPPPEH